MVPGALIIPTHHHTLSLGRDDSHLPTQTMQPRHAAAFTLIIPAQSVQCSLGTAGDIAGTFNTEN